MTDFIRRRPMLSAFLVFAVLLTLLSSVAIVPETRQGIVVRFGKPVRIVNRYIPGREFGGTGAGLTYRIPFAESFVWIDKRVLDVDMERQQVLSTDQLRLEVDAFARYRIVDPLRMYIRARSSDRVSDALRPILGSELRNELGKRSFVSLAQPRTARRDGKCPPRARPGRAAIWRGDHRRPDQEGGPARRNPAAVGL